jgi:acyl-CoA thioesterase
MEKEKQQAFMSKVSEEPFAGLIGIRLVEVGDGYALCEMVYNEAIDNIHGMAHGGAIFSLVDEAFEISSNSHGNAAVALNMNITFIRPAVRNTVLRARSTEINKGTRTATYQITVEDGEGLVAICQALAYRKRDKLSFLPD